MSINLRAAKATLGVIAASAVIGILVGYIFWYVPITYILFGLVAVVVVYFIKLVYNHFVWKYERESNTESNKEPK
jgi:hypothetical protein